jgi:hypothetical protein
MSKMQITESNELTVDIRFLDIARRRENLKLILLVANVALTQQTRHLRIAILEEQTLGASENSGIRDHNTIWRAKHN